jgi:hypothetical protein
VTPDPVLQILSDIAARLGRVEEKVERLPALEEKVDAVHVKQDKTNGRVSRLEKAAAYTAGAKAAMTWLPKLAFALVVAVAGGGAGALIGVLVGGS